MDIEMETTRQFPDSLHQLVKTQMGEMTTVITPSAAFAITPMGMQDIPASMRTETKFDLMLVLKSPEKYTFAVSGNEKIGDVNTTILTVSIDGASAKWSVDPATGRVLRSDRNTMRGQQTIDYSDWKTFSGINVPTAAAVSLNGEKQGTATVKSVEMNPTVDPKIFAKPEGK
jgi:hypothetical protein